MTMKSRLSKLEEQHPPARPGCWEADLDAGLWRELGSGQAGGPLSEAEAHLAREAGGALLRLPGGKYIVGIDGTAL